MQLTINQHRIINNKIMRIITNHAKTNKKLVNKIYLLVYKIYLLVYKIYLLVYKIYLLLLQNVLRLHNIPPLDYLGIYLFAVKFRYLLLWPNSASKSKLF